MALRARTYAGAHFRRKSQTAKAASTVLTGLERWMLEGARMITAAAARPTTAGTAAAGATRHRPAIANTPRLLPTGRWVPGLF